MKVSTKARYGLRILLQVAEDMKNNENSQGKLLATKQAISEPYLEQLMIPLKSSGLIKTQRGCKGGYRLKKPPTTITVLDVIEIFEGPFNLVDCVGMQDCARQDICFCREIWAELTEAFRAKAASISIADILDRPPQSNIPYDFVI